MSDFFKNSEWECKCGCGLGLESMNPGLVDKVVTARHLLADKDSRPSWAIDVPFVLTSPVRCANYNAREGFSMTSSHIARPEINQLCEAVDISILTNTHQDPTLIMQTRMSVMWALMAAGFARIGVRNTFIHADVSLGKTQGVFWLYTSNGVSV